MAALHPKRPSAGSVVEAKLMEMVSVGLVVVVVVVVMVLVASAMVAVAQWRLRTN